MAYACELYDCQLAETYALEKHHIYMYISVPSISLECFRSDSGMG